MYRNYDIIMLSSSRWDDEYSSSALSLAKEFSKHNRVFYIDHPFSIRDFFSFKNRNKIKSRFLALMFGKKISKKLPGASTDINIVTPMLTVPANWSKAGKLYNALTRANDAILHIAIRKIIKEHKIKKYVFINVFDPFFLKTFPATIKPAITVYYSVDDISQEKYIARHGVQLEKEAIQRANFSLATSTELVKLASKFSDRVFYLPNAADTSIFKKAVTSILLRPRELEGVKGKVICYTGVIGCRINYELIKDIATFHSDKTILFVGPVSSGDNEKEGLNIFSNIKFTGPKNITELPAYLQYSDVAIIPFSYTKLTKSIYPLKINEYLAAGKPVVSTAFSEDIKAFNDVAYIAETNQEFVQLINVAIEENNEEKRIKSIKKANANTWQNRVETFWNIVEEQTEEKAVTKQACVTY